MIVANFSPSAIYRLVNPDSIQWPKQKVDSTGLKRPYSAAFVGCNDNERDINLKVFYEVLALPAIARLNVQHEQVRILIVDRRSGLEVMIFIDHGDSGFGLEHDLNIFS